MEFIFVVVIILAFAFAALGGMLRLLLGYAAFKRQTALFAQQQRMLAGLSQLGQQSLNQPMAGPTIDPNNIHIPGGPSIVGGHVIVPGVSPQWKR
jgi:hypothetical protein